MKRHKTTIVLLLWLCGLAATRRHEREDLSFAFTAPVYNVSLEENARGTQFASSDGPIRMGVPLPEADSSVKFKIVEGDKGHHFKAHARQVGDFVFLRIRQKDKNDMPLNRELKDHYEFLVKATCKRKDAGNLETTALVRLRITDRNDASPMFTLEADRYDATITDQRPPFWDVLRIEASDADVGINGQIYYSLVNKSSEFMVDPVSGWIRTLRTLKAGTYELKGRAEDRTSRIFYFDEDQIQPDWTCDILITVTESKKVTPKILVEKRPVDSFNVDKPQLAAILRVEGGDETTRMGLIDDDRRHWFHLNSTLDGWQLYTVAGRIIPDGTNVTITAGSEMNTEANTTAHIKIDIVTSHGLSFGHSKITFTVAEGVPVGHVIGQLAADSANSNDNTLVRYHLESIDQNTSLPFRLHDETGVLRVAKHLDYENHKYYQFNVFAKLSGSGQQAMVLVEVAVTDSNDHSPVFAAKWTRQGPISIPPNTKIGYSLLKVSALDQDAGDNGKLGYKLSAEAPLPFKINFDTGEISLSTSLPAGIDEWQVIVWAVDGGRPWPRSASLNLVFYRNGTKIPPKPRPVVSAEPANEYAPVFETHQSILDAVPEDAPVGTLVGIASATDRDLGYNGLVSYSTWDEHFAVNETTGHITVARDLSLLLKPGDDKVSRDVEILASDHGEPPKTVTTTVTIDITDVNNHSPQFDKPWYRVRLSEETRVGSVVLQVAATDDDAGDSGKVGYRLAASDDGHLTVDEKSGKVTLVKPLDRETNDVISYTLVAFDDGAPQRMSFVNLTIEVGDVNDNPPQCVEKVVKVRIPEDYPDGALVSCVAASDADLGPNARLRFSIDDDVESGAHPPFRIDHHTGCVFLHTPHRPLDYQIRPVYNLSIDVSDNGESMLSTTCSLVVELIDIDENLHAPEFDDVAHEASVYENMPIGTDVFTVMAIDADKKNAQLQYAIVGGDGIGYFNIDSKGSIRTSSVLDREERWKYWLAVQVTDDATHPRSSVLHVFVRVLDKNDHRPRPTQPIYFANTKENGSQNIVVVKLEATDADDMDGDAQPLQFKITKGDPQSFFQIDANTGYITTTGSRKLDRETQREHELWVSICDSGEPQLCSTVPVVVTIDDVNDNKPEFTSPLHHYTIPSGVTGVVYRMIAKDADAGINAQLHYNITDGDARFLIDEDGYISTNEVLGSDEMFPLTVRATDRGLPAQLAHTRIVLTGSKQPDKKDKNTTPVINDKQSKAIFHISDADPVGQVIGVITASDSDGDALWWDIVDGNVDETVAMRPDTGQLILAKPIDRLPSNLTSLNLTLKVTDGNLNDTRKVVIQLSRSPSRRPQFSAQHYRTQISEKTAIGTQIYSLKATGEDVGPTTKPIVYNIFSVEDVAMEDKIRVEPSTGNVIVMESLDYETCREIRAIVSARQGSLVNYATLIIGLTDENDSAPRFLKKEHEYKVQLSASIGSVVGTLLSHDSDTGDNGVVKYTIVSGNELGFFSIDIFSGSIRVAKQLSEDYAESILTIRASDGGKNQLTDTATVRIQTVPDGDNGIRFTKPIYQRAVRESVPIGSILMVVATEPNGQARFSMKKPCPYFDVHPLSGAITLLKWLTRERSKSIECIVLAKGRDDVEHSARVIIKPTNSNQHSPVFKQQVYRGTIRENSATGSAVVLGDNSPLIVTATDKDAGPNALVGYRILNPNEPYFVVDFVSGAIRSRKPIDFEKVKEWSFHVQASDMGQPVRTSPLPALVVVTVIDANDESPTFEKDLYDTSLFLPTVSGVVIARPRAKDADTVGKLRYYLKDKSLLKLFAVNAIDGAVSVVSSNGSDYSSTEYKIDIGVTDGIHTSSCAVLIVVTSSSETTGFRCAQKEYTTSLPENTTFTEGQTLLSITAIGAAPGAPVTYTLLTERDEFIMGYGTGILALAGPALDRETETEVRLLVQARTLEHNSRTTQCVVIVRVEDKNDCDPHFVALPYRAVVSVDAKTGDKVLAVRAVDADYGSNGMVQYTSSDLPKVFKLNKHDGKISVAGKVQDGHVYHFSVDAIDQGTPPRKTTAKVRITVIEKDRPVFAENAYRTSVLESAAIETVIMSVKAVSNVNGRLVYSIESGDDDGVFVMDWDTGVLLLARSLDRETSAEYNLTVMATDVTRNEMNAVTSVNVQITGVNDNAPVFPQAVYRLSLIESTPTGAELIQISAVDPDEDRDLTYSVSGEDSGVVKIDIESGIVTLASSLDYELKQRYDLKIIASDSSQMHGEARLVIEVEDVNDEPPRFILPFQSAELSDVAEPGQFVAIMSVTDADSVSSVPDGHRLLYSVIDGDETLLIVDSHTGEVTVGRTIEDDDIIEPRKHLNVSVSDGVFTAYGQLTVTIVVSGRRQPAPRFEQSQYAVGVRENTAMENRSALLTVRARDGVPPLHYSLGGGKDYRSWPVRVDKTTGRIHQKKSLLYSNTSIHVIPLVAEDALGRRAFSTLTLNVIDENDTPPKFVVNKYSSSISAGAKEGDALLMVSATDPDEGDSIEYTLIADGEAASLFKMHPRQGILTLAGKIEKLVGSSFSFTVKATDMANPPHHATAEVSLAVLPAETPLPKFSNSHYLFNVAEDAQVGTVIGKLQQIESAVEAVRFTVAESPEGFPFMIERSSGKLIVRALLDREQKDEWRFAVKADAPGGAHTITTATVRVSDVDDNAPVFHGSYTKQTISEDAPVGTSIAVFSATDADRGAGGRIDFSILESAYSEIVRMDSESGWLLVAAPLDRETTPYYDLTARATDEGGNTADVKFRLEVTDVNDEAPQFDENTYSVKIDPSELKIGQVIAKVVVADKDLPPFNTTRLFISRGNEDALFAIDDSGIVSIARLRFPTERTLYNLSLLAFDGKHSTTATLKVNVKPSSIAECSSADINVDLLENSPEGSVVVNGTSGGPFHYQLISSEILPFIVEPNTGKITVSATVDAEKKTVYTFQLRSVSSAPQLECWQRVHVRVIDVNDHSPVFSQKEYAVTIKENQPATNEQRAFVLRVHATDKDSGLYGKIRYTLADGHGAFVMDERSGAITLTRSLDREEKDSYVLHVLASDSDPVKPKTSKAVVRISVADQNDNAPLFDKTEYNLQVMESESVGYTLATLHADGGDIGETVTYSLVKGTNNHYVTLNTATGVLTLAEGLDAEKEKLISLVVSAVDSGSPPLSSQTNVIIQILDENDNSPVFQKKAYKAEVKENVEKGTTIVKVEATDADSEHYGRVEYFLSGDASPFTVQADGWIVVSGDVDREMLSSYHFTAEARDGGNRTSRVGVTINIIDVNDNPPVFAVCNMSAIVQEGVSPGHVILSMKIHDDDSVEFGGPFKMQLKGEGSRAFIIDELLNIKTAAQLDHAKKDKFLLTVVATDKGGLSTDCPLTVYVKEESKRAPTITPLRIHLNTLKGEFKGGVIGRVVAKDMDDGDMLRYSMVDGSVVGPLSLNGSPVQTDRRKHAFRIDAESGDVWAEHSIAAGIHGFNISVTDGKYNMVSYVHIEVRSLELDVLEHAVAIRIYNMDMGTFFSNHATEFAKVFAAHLNVPVENIGLLSVQAVEDIGSRIRRSGSEAVDILFSVSRGADRGMLKPDHIYSRLKQELSNIALSTTMRYKIITEVCTPGACTRGECRERIELSDQQMTSVSVKGVAFVAPRHSRFAECSCPEGYGGSRCEIEINRCAISPCEAYQMCSPDSSLSEGYECICPPGSTGPRCEQPDCSNEGRCLEEAELSVSGNGFFEMSIANDVEMRMELDVEFRTVSIDGTLMYGKGQADYHSLEVVSGRLEYRWDAGSGVGVVNTTSQVADGKWHKVRISRRGRRTRVIVDETETKEGWSPSGAEVLNLQTAGLQLTFGAKVVKNTTSFTIEQGVAACFRAIALDGRSLAKTRQGLRLQSASPGCRAMSSTPCSESPCLHDATCVPQGKSYYCNCLERYSGQHCEIDRDPCSGRPCPIGIQCIPFYNDYLCKCPTGFTGQKCESRGSIMSDVEDACEARPCGEKGECISIPKQSVTSSGFICNCTHGLTATRCDQAYPAIFSKVSLYEIGVCLAILALIVMVVFFIIFVCRCIRRRKQDPKYGEHVAVPHLRNPHIQQVSSLPPPLPPRGFRGNKYSNFDQAQMSGLPTVQVRPFPANERLSSGRGDSRSPSLAGSGKQWKTSHDYGSAADDIHQSHYGSTHDARALEALRRFGVKLNDDDSSSTSSGPSRARRSDRNQRRGRDALDSLNQDRYPLGDSIQCLPTAADEVSGWHDNGIDRIGEAVKQERLKLEGLTGRMHVGDTVLSPLVNDDDYMTMRPRRNNDSAESQRRPLLAGHDDSDGLDGPESERAPQLPAHKNLNSDARYSDTGRLYDDPMSESQRMTTATTAEAIRDIDDIEEGREDDVTTV